VRSPPPPPPNNRQPQVRTEFLTARRQRVVGISDQSSQLSPGNYRVDAVPAVPRTHWPQRLHALPQRSPSPSSEPSVHYAAGVVVHYVCCDNKFVCPVTTPSQPIQMNCCNIATNTYAPPDDIFTNHSNHLRTPFEWLQAIFIGVFLGVPRTILMVTVFIVVHLVSYVLTMGSLAYALLIFTNNRIATRLESISSKKSSTFQTNSSFYFCSTTAPCLHVCCRVMFSKLFCYYGHQILVG
jgi:hypothetical protein